MLRLYKYFIMVLVRRLRMNHAKHFEHSFEG
jgi:hypothetical protein